MIPTYRYSKSSLMSLDLNEDHHSYQHLFNTNQVSSSSSLSCSTLFNPDQDQVGSSSYYWEPNHTQSHEEVGKLIPSRGSWDHVHQEVEKDGSISDLKVRDLEKKDGNGDFEAEDISVKCMPLKMRIKRRMMVDQMGSENKFEKPKLPISPLGTNNSISSNNSSSNSNITVRVCSDCHTTKTPLWRSGPTGPKSLCNACGIRQRKARRALAAAAESGNDTIHVMGNKLQRKGKRSKTECAQAPQLKKKRKHGNKSSRGRNKFSFDDLIISLSENLGPQQVFPQDEKEAAILLMALSYGLLHGFPQIFT